MGKNYGNKLISWAPELELNFKYCILLVLSLIFSCSGWSEKPKYQIGDLVSLNPVEVTPGVLYSVCQGVIHGIHTNYSKYGDKTITYTTKLTCEGYKTPLERNLTDESIVKVLQKNYQGLHFAPKKE